MALLAAVLGTLLSTRVAARSCIEGVFSSRIVAIEGRQLEPLLGQPASELRMWAYQAGKKSPIPFQVDPCGPDGRLLLSGSSNAFRDRPLDASSILLFVLRDAGSRMPPPVPRDVVEIEIRTAGRDDRLWTYLGSATASLALSQRDDVRYDPQSDTIFGARYTVRFRDGFADFLSLTTGAGQAGENLLDRWKIRVEARLLWGLLKFRRNEEHMNEEVVAYTDGPIRVVRRSLLNAKVGWGISSPEVIADEYFYGDHYGGPSYIRIPFRLARFFADIDVRIYFDGRNMEDFRVSVDDATAPVSWFMLAKDKLGILNRLRLGTTLQGVKSDLFYVDDASEEDEPEDVRGLRPGVGYRLTEWGSVRSGEHEMWTETYVIDPEQFEKPSSAVTRLATRPGIEVHWGESQ